MAGKIKAFQKIIADDADFKETIKGEYVFIEVSAERADAPHCESRPTHLHISSDRSLTPVATPLSH